MSAVRGFLTYLQGLDPDIVVPPQDLGHRRHRWQGQHGGSVGADQRLQDPAPA